MLADLEAAPASRRATRVPAAAQPTRQEILRLAAEGHSLRAIAGQTGISLEEARLLLAANGTTLASA
jgi:DNA-binding CsgD family transcriptional regulator